MANKKKTMNYAEIDEKNKMTPGYMPRCGPGKVMRGGKCRKLAGDDKQTFHRSKIKGFKGAAERLIPGGRSGYKTKRIITKQEGWSVENETEYQKQLKISRKNGYDRSKKY